MHNPVEEPRTVRMRGTIDKLSLALWVNAFCNGSVALALVIDAMLRS